MARNGTGGRRHPPPETDEARALRQALRREMRLRRRSLNGFRRQLATRAIVRRLKMLPAYRGARTVALYWPADGEPDVRALAPHAEARGKRLFLPVVSHEGTLRFVPWRPGSSLRRNRYGIPEPVSRRFVAPAKLDLIIAPLVAFDGQGHRLGMGGGYYDRALSGRRRHPLLVGAAFSIQEVREIPAMPWDIPLDMVVTERGLRARGAQR